MPDNCGICRLVIEDSCVTLQNISYHRECFVCYQCKVSLRGKAVHIQKGNLYDPDCFTSFLAAKCDLCFVPIAGDNVKFLKCGDKTYHMECYVCTRCRISLQGVKYSYEGDQRLCQNCSR